MEMADYQISNLYQIKTKEDVWILVFVLFVHVFSCIIKKKILFVRIFY